MDLDKDELQATHEILYSPRGYGQACFEAEKFAKVYIHNFVSDGILEQIIRIIKQEDENTFESDAQKYETIKNLLEKHSRL